MFSVRNSTQHQNRKNRIKSVFAKKSKGMGWLLGIWMIFALMSLMLLLLQKYKLEIIKEEVSDVLTSSSLAVLQYDYRGYALNHNEIFEDTDDTYEKLCDTVAKQLGMKNTKNVMYEDAEVPLNPYIKTNASNPCIVKKVILYEYYPNRMQKYKAYEYGDDATRKSVTAGNDYKISLTNKDVPVEDMSVYVEFEFPIKIFGIEKRVVKGELVSLKTNE